MAKNNKKQPKDKFPDNMPTGLNMTWWYMDDVETLLASMQLRLDYMQQRLRETQAEIEELREEKNSAKNKLTNLSNQFKELRKKTQHKIHHLEICMQDKLKELEVKYKTKN